MRNINIVTIINCQKTEKDIYQKKLSVGFIDHKDRLKISGVVMKVIKKIRFYSCILVVVMFSNSAVFAEMMPVSDTELDSVTAQTFSNFTYSEYSHPKVNDANGNPLSMVQMRIDINTKIEFRTRIDHLRMGYFNWTGATGVNGSFWGNGTGDGWNLSADGFQMGKYSGWHGASSNENFVFENLTIRTDYIINDHDNNPATPSQKVLNTFAIGSDYANGWLYADNFPSFTGVMSPDLVKEAAGSAVTWLLNGLMDSWTYRTSVLNVNFPWPVSGRLRDLGIHYQSGSSAFYIVIDKNLGVGSWGGPPISELYDHWGS